MLLSSCYIPFVRTNINIAQLICFIAPEMVDKSVDAILLKLRGLYTRAKDLSESEIR